MKVFTPRPISLWLGPIEVSVFASLLAFSSQLMVSIIILYNVRQLLHRVT